MTTPDPVADARESLRARINTAIAPWRTSSEQPPFNTKKLVIMALILSDIALTQKEVWLWMMANFSYYQNIAADALWNCNNSETQEEAKDLREELGAVYSLYEIPFIITNAAAADRGDVRYTITPLMGEALLHLPGEKLVDNSIFPFFELPAELRDVIYTMVFQYPRSGIGLHWQGPYVLTRDLDDHSTFDHMRAAVGRTLPIKKMCDILSPLLISRQFYNEAMPILFDINTFQFESQAHLSRRKHVRSVGFKWAHKGFIYECNLEALTHLPNLKRLALWFDRRRSSDWYGAELAHIWKHSGNMKMLRRVQGLEEIECINLPALQKLMEREMCQPKAVG
ncbi:hypothetical protein LTR10_010529 [Elasticomyces elasticus]|nr:hypothetical protein LTR10_010529 [Elasticomyces elasticus]KAK4972429.1 hypothetical protein LTR42_006938 [Elasticomyces elasticus]